MNQISADIYIYELIETFVLITLLETNSFTHLCNALSNFK